MSPTNYKVLDLGSPKWHNYRKQADKDIRWGCWK